MVTGKGTYKIKVWISNHFAKFDKNGFITQDRKCITVLKTTSVSKWFEPWRLSLPRSSVAPWKWQSDLQKLWIIYKMHALSENGLRRHFLPGTIIFTLGSQYRFRIACLSIQNPWSSIWFGQLIEPNPLIIHPCSALNHRLPPGLLQVHCTHYGVRCLQQTPKPFWHITQIFLSW